MINSLIKKVQTVSAERSLFQKQIKEEQQKLKVLEESLDYVQKARDIFQAASQTTQGKLVSGISDVVDAAIKTIPFDEDYSFKLNFVTKRNQTECEFFLVKDGIECDPLETSGGGVVDVIDFALRVAYVNMDDSVNNILILDEPFRNLDAEKQPYAAQMMKILSEKLGVQMIVSTHVDSIRECADKVFPIIRKEKRSMVEI